MKNPLTRDAIVDSLADAGEVLEVPGCRLHLVESVGAEDVMYKREISTKMLKEKPSNFREKGIRGVQKKRPWKEIVDDKDDIELKK